MRFKKVFLDLGMMKFPKTLLLATIICFVFNLTKQNPLTVSAANAILFFGYANLFSGIINLSSKVLILLFMALMPIFALDHLYPPIYLVEVTILLSWYLLAKTPKKYLLFFGLLVFVFYSYFALLSNHLVRWPLKLEVERLIYPQEPYQLEIDRQMKEALYLPYRLRLLVFNNVVSYGYILVSNIFTFLSLENLYRTVLLVNAILVIIGIFNFNKLPPAFKVLAIGAVSITLLVVGLIKTPDSMRPLACLRGVLLLLALNGFNCQPSWAFYLSLFILSLMVNVGLRL